MAQLFVICNFFVLDLSKINQFELGAKICVTKGVKTVTKTKTRLVETSFTD